MTNCTGAGGASAGAGLYRQTGRLGESNPGFDHGTFPRTALVDLGVIKAWLACDSEEATELIESGRIPWAFDLSAGACRIRELRVWSGSLRQPEAAQSATLEQVLDEVVGGRFYGPETPASRLERRWVMSTRHVIRLRRANLIRGEIRAHCLWLSKDSLREFLTQRWIH